MRELVNKGLSHTSKWVKYKKDFLDILSEFNPDIVLCDFNMPNFSAPEALEIVKKNYPEIPFIVVSGTIGEELAVEMMRKGASDYVMKDRIFKLVPAIERALREKNEHIERKKAEAFLNKLAEEQRTIFDIVPAMIWYKDTKNNIVRINQAAAKSMGMAIKDIEGKSIYQLFPQEAEHYYQDDLEVINTGQPKLGIIELLQTGSGEKLWVETNKVPYRDLDGNIVGIIVFSVDVTEHKRVEEILKQVARTKSAFTSMVSHELRTPLTALRESVSQVAEGLLGAINNDQKRFLDIARNNVDRLARLINEVLDFQTFGTGKVLFKIEENDINKVVSDIKDIMLPLAQKKGLEFIVKFDHDLPKIRFDYDKITQVLTNIVKNSLKLTKKGSITISTTRGNNVVQVSVTDTGPGIEEINMPRLFLQYEQLERKTGGTGLGLAISLQIIGAHGGKIWAESVFGHGTTLHFILPIKEQRNEIAI